MNTPLPSFNKPTEIKKWTITLLTALFLSGVNLVYLSLIGISIISLQTVSFTLAATASLLFAIALSLGSFSYYTGWPNMRLGYQKQIGVLAYWFSFLYCATLVVLYPEVYLHGLKDSMFTVDVILGVLAMLIFTAMVSINSKYISHHFNIETIKFILGLGYVGYALLVMRAIFIEWPLWEDWLLTFESYPPGRFILAAIALGVLLLRVSIPIHKKLIAKKH